MSVLLSLASQDPITFEADTFVEEAANKMTELDVGAALVSQDGKIIGIFTERDVLHKMLPKRMAGKTTFVEEIMTSELITVNLDTPPAEALALMINHNIRHLPIKGEDGEILGLLSLKRVMKHYVKVLAKSVKELKHEIDVLV